MNPIAVRSSGINPWLIITLMIMGMLFNSCKKDKFSVPLNVGTIRFAANAYTIENNTIDPLTIVLPLSLPLEEEASVLISVDGQSSIAANEYTITPAIPAGGLTLKLPKGATEVTFQVSSLNNFEGEKSLVLKLSAASGGLSVANTNATSNITIKGNPVILPEIKASESGLAFGNVVTAGISDSKSYVLTGVKLSADVLVSASANFQVSMDDQNFSSTLTIPFATLNAAPVTIHARFIANTGINQTVTGLITHSSGTVPDAVLSVSGIEYGVAAPGVLIKKEDLDYGTLNGALSARGGGSWATFSAAGSSAVQYVTAGLTYTGYTGSGIGGALVSENGSGSREDISWAFPAQSSGVIYTAQMINFASAPATADFFLSLGDGAPGTTPAYFNRIYAKANGSQLSLGIGRNSATAVYGTAGLDYGKTYLVVHKYEFVTGNSALYVMGSAIPVIEPPVANAISVATGDPASITRVVIRQNTNAPLKATIDGIRVATSWKEAVGL